MGTTVKHQPYQGDRTFIRVGFGKVEPTAQAVTLGAAATKGAATLTVTALSAPIDKNNYLLFTDADGLEYVAKLTADAAAAATSLTVAALPEAIPSGAVANWPPELLDRSSVEIGRSYNTQEVVTLNTGGNRNIVAINASKNVNAPGFWYYKNAGYLTAALAAELKKELWVMVEFEPPSDAFSKGMKVSGKAIVTDRPTPSPADNFVGGDIQFEYTGPVSEADPTPTA